MPPELRIVYVLNSRLLQPRNILATKHITQNLLTLVFELILKIFIGRLVLNSFNFLASVQLLLFTQTAAPVFPNR